MHVVHLNKGGKGMASMTACGRNIRRTPLATNWEEFKNEPHKCEKCANSKQAALNAKNDANKWEPEDSDAWMKNDDALVAGRK